jgi:hypothetical protein
MISLEMKVYQYLKAHLKQTVSLVNFSYVPTCKGRNLRDNLTKTIIFNTHTDHNIVNLFFIPAQVEIYWATLGKLCK